MHIVNRRYSYGVTDTTTVFEGGGVRVLEGGVDLEGDGVALLEGVSDVVWVEIV
jgi:hypothetical protein